MLAPGSVYYLPVSEVAQNIQHLTVEPGYLIIILS